MERGCRPRPSLWPRSSATGWASRRTAALRPAPVFGYPSGFRGFRLPPPEAVAAGGPGVARAGGAVPGAGGDAACLVPVGDIDAMASSLAALLDDAELRARLIDRG